MKLVKIIVSIFLINALSQTTNAQSFNTARMDSLLDILHENDKFMGSVAVSRKGTLLYANAIGYDDIKTKRKSTVNTKYKIGSITKVFTSVLIFLAIEDQKLKLSDKLNEYFPTIKNSDRITIDHLLSHRSGIHNFTSGSDYSKWSRKAKSRQEMVGIISGYESEFAPDSKADYSNSNYVVLGYVLEEIYQKKYAELVQERIVKPLGLQNTYLGSSIDISNNECYSYNFRSGKSRQNETHASIPFAAGAMASTPIDLNKFIQHLFAGNIISHESIEEMTTIRDSYGRGIFVTPYNQKKGYGHNGGIDGFSSFLGFIEKDS